MLVVGNEASVGWLHHDRSASTNFETNSKQQKQLPDTSIRPHLTLLSDARKSHKGTDMSCKHNSHKKEELQWYPVYGLLKPPAFLSIAPKKKERKSRSSGGISLNWRKSMEKKTPPSRCLCKINQSVDQAQLFQRYLPSLSNLVTSSALSQCEKGDQQNK
jgi:hypothetical protein